MLDLSRIPLCKGLPAEQEEVQQCELSTGRSNSGECGKRNTKDQHNLGESTSWPLDLYG